MAAARKFILWSLVLLSLLFDIAGLLIYLSDPAEHYILVYFIAIIMGILSFIYLVTSMGWIKYIAYTIALMVAAGLIAAPLILGNGVLPNYVFALVASGIGIALHFCVFLGMYKDRAVNHTH